MMDWRETGSILSWGDRPDFLTLLKDFLELIYKENLKELKSFAVLALQPVITRQG
jgi:hypothetical protein